MQNRMLNIYLYQKNNRLKLRMIEIHPLDHLSSMSSDDGMDQARIRSVFANLLYGSLLTYNGIETWNDGDAEELKQVCYLDHPFTVEIIKDPSHFNTRYSYTDVVWTLAYDAKLTFDEFFDTDGEDNLLLKQLGALDNAIHSFLMNAKESGVTCHIFYHDTCPNFSNKTSIIYNSLLASRANYTQPTQSLSRHVASWIQAELNKNPDSQKMNKKIINALTQFLATNDQSLSRVIREKIYPDMPIDKLLDWICLDDEIAVALLDPTIPFKQATQILLDDLKSQLYLHPFAKEESWQKTIASTFGNPAHDGKKYNSTYTEVQLLSQAKLSYEEKINTYTIQFLDTEAYKKFYKRGQQNYGILKAELEFIAKPMGLSFLPDQDFHKGTLTFTAKPPLFVWFNEFDKMRNKFWIHMVNTVLSKPAVDGGFYSSKYTEVALLRESTIHFSKNGRFALQFLNTDSYSKHYAKGQRLYDMLETELRAVCKLLGLSFLPNQDFHTGTAYFTPESDLYFKNHGFHISEHYCKAVMNTSTLFRLFKAKNEENSFHLLHADAQISVVEFVEPELPRSEIERIRNN